MTDPILQSRAEKLFYYSPYNFLREIDPAVLKELEISKIKTWKSNPDNFTLTYEVSTFRIEFYLQALPWDTAFFNLNTIKLVYCLFDCPVKVLENACRQLLEDLSNLHYSYFFTEIPSEDIVLLQALTGSGLKLIETRLAYFNNNLSAHAENRYQVRIATQKDIPNLRRVASQMRNDYDRFHADPAFNPDQADEFLARYVEEAIKGFSDLVLVPAEPGLPSDSFLTANYLKETWQELNFPVSKMVLSAVSSATNKGWYFKLVSEMMYFLSTEGAKAAFMNTQSTNRAVFRTWEKLGFKLGATTHILAANF